MARNPGLSDEQVTQLRADLAGGNFPRVRFVGTQPGASTGTVRRVGDPATDGEDFVVVRVKINGVTDDLRFAPQELRRGGAPATTPSAPPAKKTANTPKKAARKATPAPAKKAAAAPAKKTAAKARATRAPANRASAPPTPVKSAARTAIAKAAEPSATPTAKRKPVRRAGYGPPVVITLRSSEASWTMSAQRGARSVLKSVAVNPGIVSAIAELLDDPAVTETVAGVNDIALADAESRAEVLRAELEQIQAVLDTHRRP